MAQAVDPDADNFVSQTFQLAGRLQDRRMLCRGNKDLVAAALFCLRGTKQDGIV